jgi:cobaltochelatase CobS
MTSAFPLRAASYSLATEFGLEGVNPSVQISGFEPGHPAVPPLQEYVFMRAKLRDMLAFWESGLNAMKFTGDPGTGKTSIIQQFHARLRWPLYSYSCSPSTEAYQLIGQLLPTESGTPPLRWVDGPVLRAAREGTSCMLDEWNVIDPGQGTGVNMLLEGYSITIPETGEIVHPNPGFRVFATENPVDSRLSIAGRNVQDVANEDRWMVSDMDYLPEDLEVKAVVKALLADGTSPDVAEMLAQQVVRTANDVRAAYRANSEAIEKPMSTRVAIRWAKLVRRFQNVTAAEGGPVLYALCRAYSMNRAMSAAVEEYVRARFGT